MVMFNMDVRKLMEMLRVVNFWVFEMAMRINATKIKIMSMGRGAPQLPVDTPIHSGSMSQPYFGQVWG